ncbi:MAG TPA: aryl-sulfate sulfotransferase [Candidatus Acidoferrales bacterium]|nr:aryl-sulfate sulfotransferase [Candidatus Acidoferrales bacterium]
MRQKLASGILFLLFAFAFFLSGCAQSSVTVSISPNSATAGGDQTVQFTATVTGSSAGVIWSVDNIPGGNATVGTIDAQGLYTAPSSAASVQVAATSRADPSKSAQASVSVVVSGPVTPTNNPQVAVYTITVPAGASVAIQFGPDTNYRFTTWTQPAPAEGGPVSILVGGMLANATYHMRASVALADGSNFLDADHTFVTGGLPAGLQAMVRANTTPGMTPQAGVELVSLLPATPFASDLDGNIIWSYTGGNSPGSYVQVIKLLPNGHFILLFAPNTSALFYGQVRPGGINLIREIDLAGNTIRELNIGNFNARLASAGFSVTAQDFHHDILPLPNGHFIVLASITKQFSNLPGLAGTTTVLGDILVDLDTNWNPVWVWNAFDHLDINRRPYLFPDWTHSNAILYSPDDGNLILSMRHQSWLLKLDYNNGKGAGDILWHLGYQGDFALQGGTDPTDWFYAQHGPSFFSPNTTGQFSMGVFDNGDDRVYPPGQTCQSLGLPQCPYSSVVALKIDETAKTATIVFHDKPAPAFSFFGGNADLLKNSNVQFDEAATPSQQADLYEVTQTDPPQTIWHMHCNQYALRGTRLPSLYPGVQW